MTARYHQWIRQESLICKTFQEYINRKRNCLSYLSKRENPQASIDFLWRLYNKENNQTITELAVEVRSLRLSKSQIESSKWHIEFPISKLNELMQFWRMWKEIYIVYRLRNWTYFLNWDYYLKHNFEIWVASNKNYIKLPIQNFISC